MKMPFTLFQLTWNTFLKATHSEYCILYLKMFPYIVPEKGKVRTYMMDTIIYKDIYIPHLLLCLDEATSGTR